MNIDLGILMVVIGVLVFITNSIVECIKMAFFIEGAEKLNKLALGTGVFVTVLTYFAYIGYSKSSFIWYYFIGSIFLGFIVALIAMLGYDKVLQIWQESNRSDRK